MAEGQLGKGVFIGIIDSGVNILHPTFETTDATPRTRIEWLKVEEVIPGVTTEFDSAMINRVLDKSHRRRRFQAAVRERARSKIRHLSRADFEMSASLAVIGKWYRSLVLSADPEFTQDLLPPSPQHKELPPEESG